jgi:nicotinamidase-related amidase
MSIRELLNPTNSALILIDHQPQMAFSPSIVRP